jgi:diaminopimelate epimerase
MTTVHFEKMQGLGNDFIMVNCLAHAYNIAALEAKAEAWCDRHFGIGADGLILVMPSTTHDFRMRILNADGSEAEMCGNGIRCFAVYAYTHGLTEKTTFTVETLAGTITPVMQLENGHVRGVRVDMGEPRLERADIPMAGPAGQVVGEALLAGDRTFAVTAVSMGNPHAVIFVDDVAAFPVEHYGAIIETCAAFPRRTNVEFVQTITPGHLKMRVWERGSGITLACGTGACATLVAGVLTGNADRTATVELPGGPLEITWSDADNHVYMTGPAETVFTGEIGL